MRFKRIYVEITNICNLKCSFCPPHHRKNRTMTFEEFQTILCKIKPYTQYIYLHVKGEPLLHPEVDHFIQYAYEQGFFINLTTNGTKLREHLPITKYLRQINISVHATNSQEIIDTAKKIQDTIINFRVWNKSRNAKAISILEDTFHTIIPDTPQYTLGENIFLSQDELFEWPDLSKQENESDGYCHALKAQIAILVDGTVVPCCLDHNGEIPLGNIYYQSFEEIITSSKVTEILEGFQRRVATQELCKRCTFKNKF